MKKLLLLSVITMITFGCKSQHDKDYEAFQKQKETSEMFEAKMQDQNDSINRVMYRKRVEKQAAAFGPDNNLLNPPNDTTITN